MEFRKVKAVTHDLKDLLSSSDSLINKDEDEVEIESLKGKTVGFYFSAIWSRPCQRFTRILIETYEEIIKSCNGELFEIVFVSGDENEKRFEENIGKMPWIAIPYLDSETRSHLDEVFEVRGLPHLAIVDENGKLVLNYNGVEIVRAYGAEAYPFKPETIQNLKHRDEVAKINPIFASRSRVVSSSTGNQVAVSDLEGKIVGLYFTMFSFKACVDFTPKLVQVYQQLKANGESFEIVMIKLYDDDDDNEEDFESNNNNIPWLSIPFKDKISTWKLVQFFDVSTLPTLVIIGKDGKILQSKNKNVKEAIEEHGVLAFPFTPKRLEELRDLVREKEEALTLDSLLVSGDDQDFVITKDGDKIPMEALSGKNILLYFSANWSWQCRAFNDQLIKAYENINEKEDDDLEVVFISSDKNEGSYKTFFSEMPWLSLPYRDSRNSLLKRTFKTHDPFEIPTVVAFGAEGRFVSKNVKNMIKYYGAEAYPFTEERLNEMMIELRRRWPGKVKHKLHEEHELVLEYRGMNYLCNKCFELGLLLSFCCPICDFDLHYKCALG